MECNKLYCNFTAAVDIGFEQSTYNVSEGDGPLRPAIILSNRASIDIMIEVDGRPGTATGSNY